jgi:hypothetical protein
MVADAAIILLDPDVFEGSLLIQTRVDGGMGSQKDDVRNFNMSKFD